MKVNSVCVQSYGPTQGITGSRLMCATVHLISHQPGLKSTTKTKDRNHWSREYTSCKKHCTPLYKSAQIRLFPAHRTTGSSRLIHCLVHVKRTPSHKLFISAPLQWIAMLSPKQVHLLSDSVSLTPAERRREPWIKHYFHWLLCSLFESWGEGSLMGHYSMLNLFTMMLENKNSHSGDYKGCMWYSKHKQRRHPAAYHSLTTVHSAEKLVLQQT